MYAMYQLSIAFFNKIRGNRKAEGDIGRARLMPNSKSLACNGRCCAAAKSPVLLRYSKVTNFACVL